MVWSPGSSNTSQSGSQNASGEGLEPRLAGNRRKGRTLVKATSAKTRSCEWRRSEDVRPLNPDSSNV